MVSVLGYEARRWYSAYDDQYIDGSGLDVDHRVPLAEAWDSGASAWSAAERQAYANDLGDERSLIAVSAKSNRSKADQDPSTWMPPFEGPDVRNWFPHEWQCVERRKKRDQMVPTGVSQKVKTTRSPRHIGSNYRVPAHLIAQRGR